MECTHDYYIHNFKLYDSSNFDENILTDGIAVYEVIRIEKNIALFLEEHLSRLYYSSEIHSLQINEGYCDFETLVEQLLEKNKISTGKIKIVVNFDKESRQEKDILIYFTSHYFPSEDELKTGVNVGVHCGERTKPNAKILNTPIRTKTDYLIAENDIFEVLLLDSDGCITEGSRSNVFFIKDNTIITSLEHDVLNGVTRTKLLKAFKQNNIELDQRKISLSEIEEMDCAFLTGTSIGILPIKNINGKNLNTNNNLLIKIKDLYNNLVNDYLEYN